MLKKFLAFLGLSSVKLEDGKATVEMTEEQMEASGQIISERDEALANVERLSAELETANSQTAEINFKLSEANTLTASLTEDNATLKAEVATLKTLPATETTTAVTSKNKEPLGEVDPCVAKGDDFVADMHAIKEAYL